MSNKLCNFLIKVWSLFIQKSKFLKLLQINIFFCFNTFKFINFNTQQTIQMQAGQQIKLLPTNYSPFEMFKLELTQQQQMFLAALLPKNYSLQVDARPKRQIKMSLTQKKKGMVQDSVDSGISPSQPQGSMYKSKQKIQEKPPVLNSKSSIQKKQSKLQVQLGQPMKLCLKILGALKNSKYSWAFKDPVDPIELGIPQYYQIIKQPMDLETVDRKLKSGEYSNPNQFHADINKIITNSYVFNHANQDFIKLTSDFQKSYERICNQNKAVVEMPPKPIQVATTTSKNQKKKKKANTSNSKQLNDMQPITLAQKQELAYNIQRLAKQHIRGVLNIVFDGKTNQFRTEFDLQSLDQKKLRELQKYIRNKMIMMEHNEKMKQQERAQNPDTNDLISDQQSFILDS